MIKKYFATLLGLFVFVFSFNSLAKETRSIPKDPYQWANKLLQDFIEPESEKSEAPNFQVFLPKIDLKNLKSSPKSMLQLTWGSGHGGSLRLLTIIRDKESVQVLKFSLDEPSLGTKNPVGTPCHPIESKFKPYPECNFVTNLESGTMDLKSFEKLFQTIMILKNTKIYSMDHTNNFQPYVDPQSKTNELEGEALLSSFSSANYVNSINATFGPENGFQYYFSGYPSNDEPIQHAAPNAIQNAIVESIETSSFNKINIADAKHRTVFHNHMAFLSEEWDDENSWWVKERLIEMMAHFGTNEEVKILKSVIQQSGKKNDSKKRLQYKAINALAVLTGKDFRYSTDGEALPLDSVVKKYSIK